MAGPAPPARPLSFVIAALVGLLIVGAIVTRGGAPGGSPYAVTAAQLEGVKFDGLWKQVSGDCGPRHWATVVGLIRMGPQLSVNAFDMDTVTGTLLTPTTFSVSLQR